MAHLGYCGLNEQQIKIADGFYERIKDLPIEVVKRYRKYISPRTLLHFYRIFIDEEFREKTRARRSACLRLLIENSSEGL